MNVLESLLDLLFPPKCPFCGRVLDKAGICPNCEKELPWTQDAEALWEGPGDLCCAAPLWYKDLAREGILRFKFRGSSAAARPIGEMMARCAAEHLSSRFDTVTWVPVSSKRLRKRGYDQARLLAEAVCRQWDTKPVQLLEKIADTPAQSGLREAAARRANVLGVYEVTEIHLVEGKRILLVDDICTTGATLVECIRVLKDAGAAEVVCLTAARTPEGAGRKTAESLEKRG